MHYTGCDKFAGNKLCLPGTSTIVFFVYFIYLKAISSSREHHCVHLLEGDFVQQGTPVYVACGCLLIVHLEMSSRLCLKTSSMKVGLQPSPQTMETRRKSFCKTSFQVGPYL